MFTNISSDVVVVTVATEPNFDYFTTLGEFQYAFRLLDTSGCSFGGHLRSSRVKYSLYNREYYSPFMHLDIIF